MKKSIACWQGDCRLSRMWPQLKYTEMVLAESMRLYPPAWAIGPAGDAKTARLADT